MKSRLVALCCATLLGCSNAPESPTKAFAQKSAQTQSAESKKPAENKAEKPKSAPSEKALAAREARFKERATVSPISSLPKGFSQFASKVQGRLTAASDEIRTFVGNEKPWRSISVEVRLFGTDEDVDKRLLKALKDLDLKGLSGELPENPVTVGAITWDLQRFRSKVADENPGEFPRETRALLSWRRTTITPKDAAKCKKPVSVDFHAPTWLQKATAQTTTRRRVSAGNSVDSKENVASCRLFFPIGESHDEGVGTLRDAAKEAGLIHREGDGPKQVWSDKANKKILSWRPDKSELGLGCAIKGPVLLVEWKELQ